MFNQSPFAVKQDGQWHGRDYQQLKLITSMMNASFKIMPPQENERLSYTDAYNDIAAKKVDMCFISHFQVINHFKKVSYTYPHESNSLVIFMPATKSLKKRKSLFSIFGKYVWILLCVLIITMFISLLITQKPYSKNNFCNGFVTLSAIMFSLPAPHFSKRKTLVKYQLHLFCLACMIFRTAFQCFIISSIVSPMQVDKIKKISEVTNLNIRIYSSQTLVDLIPEQYKIKDQLAIITRKDRYRKIFNFDDPNAAFFLTSIQAEMILSRLRNQMKKLPFYVVKEALIPGFDNYILQRHSPFTQKINGLLLKEVQYGFDQVLDMIDNNNNTLRNQTDAENVALNMRHMSSVFVVLTIGLLVSFFVLLLELRLKI